MDDNLVQLGSPYKGKKFLGSVVQNNDPAKLYRLQILVPGVFDGVPEANLPWALPDAHSGIGDTGSVNVCAVPRIGAVLWVWFQDGDPHYPVYSGCAAIPGTLSPVFATNYPDRQGWLDSKGNHFYTDMSTGDVELSHFSGTVLHINPDGSVHLVAVQPITSSAPAWNHTGPVNITGNVDITGNCTVSGNESVGGNLTVTGSSTLG